MQQISIFTPFTKVLLCSILFCLSWSNFNYAQCTYPPNFQLIEGQDASTMSTTLAKPNKGAYYTDPNYGTCITRVTDHETEPPNTFARNDYSRRQAFNADDSRLLVYSFNGFWHLYDANTFEYLSVLSNFTGPGFGLAGDAEPQWHPTDPNILYFISSFGGMQIFQVDISTNVSSVAADFTGRLPWGNAARCWTGSEGSPSADGRYWGFRVEDNDFNILGLMVYDMQNDAIIGTKSLTIRPDAVSMSPSGRWFTTTGFEGTFAYSPNFSMTKTIHHTVEHSDIALNEEGEDIYIQSDYSAGTLKATNLDTDEVWTMYNLYESGNDVEIASFHFSGKAYNNPGWVLISTYVNGVDWVRHKLFAMELKPNPTLLNLGHTYSDVDFNDVAGGYFSQPHASVNRDFTKVVWNSNWQTGQQSDIDVYMMTLPSGAVGNETVSQNAVISGTIRLDATYEHISVLWEISNDDNHNSNMSIEYRPTGSGTYLMGAKTMRAYPSMQVDGSTLNKNHHAGSALFLQPGTSYDLRLTLTDPDGGSTTQLRTIFTKSPQQASLSGTTYYVAPGNGGGNGTMGNPFLGLQTAANNANAGDIFMVMDGTYAPFTLTTDGTTGNPIVFQSQNQHGAIIDGGNTGTGIVNIGDFSQTTEYVIIDGFVIQNGYWGINAENTAFLTIRNNIIQDVGYGFNNRRENGWEHNQTIENNVFIGRNTWPSGSIPAERGIDIRGNNNVVRYNTIQYFGDGVSTDGPAYEVSYSMDIYYNDIAYCVDDGIEVDGTIANTRIYRNRAYNSRAGISVAPIFGGPCYVFRNELFNQEPGFSAYKMNRSPAGLIIAHNTSNKLSNGSSSPSGWQNTYFRNNIIMGTRYVFEEYGLVSGSVDDWNYNAYFSTRSGTAGDEWFKWVNERYADIAALQAGTDIETNGIAIAMSDINNAVLPTTYETGVAPNERDLTLTNGSTAINSGATLDNMNLPFVFDGQPDRGAYEFGQPYPEFGANFDDNPLSAYQMNFTANQENSWVRLEWQKHQNSTLDYAILERAADGENFENIGQVHAKNPSYFLDQQPFMGVNYYRLKQIHLDGSIQYSTIETVDFQYSQIRIYPNPANGVLYWKWKNQYNTERSLQWSFYQPNGQLIQTFWSEQQALDISFLEKGIYVVKVRNGAVSIVKKLVVN